MLARKVIIYDKDGTLDDSEPGWYKFLELVKKRKFRVSAEDEQRLRYLSHRQGFWEALEEYWPLLDVPSVKKEWKLGNTREAARLFSRVQEMIRAIYVSRIVQVVFSARDKESTCSHLEMQHILRYFRMIFTQEDFSPYQKADPESLQRLLKILKSDFGIFPHEILYAGDTPEVDGRVARLVGLVDLEGFYGIARTPEKRRDFLSEGIPPEFIVGCITEIPLLQPFLAKAA